MVPCSVNFTALLSRLFRIWRQAFFVAGNHRGQGRFYPVGERQPLLLGPNPEERRHVRQERGQRHRRLLKVEPPGFNFGNIQHLVDQRQQVFTTGADNAQTALLSAAQIRIALEQLRKAQNAVEGRPEFVAHVGQKFAF